MARPNPRAIALEYRRSTYVAFGVVFLIALGSSCANAGKNTTYVDTFVEKEIGKARNDTTMTVANLRGHIKLPAPIRPSPMEEERKRNVTGLHLSNKDKRNTTKEYQPLNNSTRNEQVKYEHRAHFHNGNNSTVTNSTRVINDFPEIVSKNSTIVADVTGNVTHVSNSPYHNKTTSEYPKTSNTTHADVNPLPVHNQGNSTTKSGNDTFTQHYSPEIIRNDTSNNTNNVTSEYIYTLDDILKSNSTVPSNRTFSESLENPLSPANGTNTQNVESGVSLQHNKTSHLVESALNANITTIKDSLGGKTINSTEIQHTWTNSTSYPSQSKNNTSLKSMDESNSLPTQSHDISANVTKEVLIRHNSTNNTFINPLIEPPTNKANDSRIHVGNDDENMNASRNTTLSKDGGDVGDQENVKLDDDNKIVEPGNEEPNHDDEQGADKIIEPGNEEPIQDGQDGDNKIIEPGNEQPIQDGDDADKIIEPGNEQPIQDGDGDDDDDDDDDDDKIVEPGNDEAPKNDVDGDKVVEPENEQPNQGNDDNKIIEPGNDEEHPAVIKQEPIDNEHNEPVIEDYENPIQDEKVASKERLRFVAVIPESGPTNGGSLVQVTGSGFSSHDSIFCRFGDNFVLAEILSDILATCFSPAKDETTPTRVSFRLCVGKTDECSEETRVWEFVNPPRYVAYESTADGSDSSTFAYMSVRFMIGGVVLVLVGLILRKRQRGPVPRALSVPSGRKEE